MATQIITPKFQLGDCVKLPSCSQKMTVTILFKYPDFGKIKNRYTGYVECSWFDGLQLQKEKFHQDALVKCDECYCDDETNSAEDPILKTMSVVINKSSRS